MFTDVQLLTILAITMPLLLVFKMSLFSLKFSKNESRFSRLNIFRISLILIAIILFSIFQFCYPIYCNFIPNFINLK